MVDVVGLGGGDEDAVDATREPAGQDAAAPRPEAGQDLRQRPLEVGHGRGPGIERLHGVDQDDLPVEPRHMFAEEGLDHMRLVRLVAPLHHRQQRSAPASAAVHPRQRCEGERRRAVEVSGHQEATGRQGGQRARVVLAGLEIGREGLRETARSHFVGVAVRIDGRSQRPPGFRQVVACRQVGEFERLARELGIAFPQQGQVEQPLAGIVDDVERQPAGREEPAPARSRFELDRQAQFRDGAGRFGPPPVVDQRGDVILVLEARHGVVGLMFEEGARDAPRTLCREQGKAPAMHQIVDQGRDEHRLAGARQTGDAEPQRRRQEAGRPPGKRVHRDAGFVGECGQGGQSRAFRSNRPDIGEATPV